MRCPGCQQENPEGARFCNSCGTRLTAAVPTAVPRTYTPAHLAEKILTSRSAMVGERKQVTMLDDLIPSCYLSRDFHEGVRAFLEKRKPDWQGR
jgi:enoyl-CoA hydratase/carnithine racemase